MTAVEAPPASGAGLRLGPNPAASSVQVELAPERAAELKVEVFDVRGVRVRTLRNGRFAAGRHRLSWDLRDASGARARAGIYWVRTTGAAARAARSVAVLR